MFSFDVPFKHEVVKCTSHCTYTSFLTDMISFLPRQCLHLLVADYEKTYGCDITYSSTAEKESVESASLNSDEEAARDYLHLTDDLAPPLPFEEPELPQDASHAIYINTARALTPMQK